MKSIASVWVFRFKSSSFVSATFQNLYNTLGIKSCLADLMTGHASFPCSVRSPSRGAARGKRAPPAPCEHCPHRPPRDHSAQWGLITKLARSSVVGIKTASAFQIIPFSNVIKFWVTDLEWGTLPTGAVSWRSAGEQSIQRKQAREMQVPWLGLCLKIFPRPH